MSLLVATVLVAQWCECLQLLRPCKGAAGVGQRSGGSLCNGRDSFRASRPRPWLLHRARCKALALLEACVCSHDHARRAETALRAIKVGDALLDGVKTVAYAAKTVRSGDGCAVEGGESHKAGIGTDVANATARIISAPNCDRRRSHPAHRLAWWP